MHPRSRPVRRRHVLGGAAALLAGGATSLLRLSRVAAGPPLAFTKSNNSTGNQPYSMARDDLNGDGWPDLVTANSGDGTVTILLNNGNGTLTAATNSPITVPGGDFRVIIADFFNTGKPAIAAFGPNKITLFPNLTPPGSSAITLGAGVVTTFGGASAVATGDLDRDGKMDIVYAAAAISPPNTGTINVLYGKGDGTFRTGPSFPIPTIIYGLDLVDLNGDGFPELVGSRALSNNQLFVWNQTPNGGWAGAAGSPYTTHPYSGTAAIATLTAGQPPVIAVPCINTGPGSNVIDLFQCGGTYTHPFCTPMAGSPLPTCDGAAGLTFVDLDGGGPSLGATSTNNSLNVHTPKVGGGFNPFVSFPDPSINGPIALVPLSLDASGKSGLAMLSYDGNKVTVFANTTAYTPTLRIDDFPLKGPVYGGNIVIINGAGFKPGDKVLFDQFEATGVSVLDGGTIYARAPHGQFKVGDTQNFASITIKHLDGMSITAPLPYRYEGKPEAPVDTNGPPHALPPVQPPGPAAPGNPPAGPGPKPRPQGQSGGVPAPAPTHR